VPASERRERALGLKRPLADLADQVASWTAMQRPLIRKLIESVQKRSAQLGLVIDRRREAENLSELSVFVTTLVMSHLARSKSFQA